MTNDDHSASSGQRHVDSDQTAIDLIQSGAPLNDAHTLCLAAALSPAVIALLRERNVDIGALRACDNSTPLHIAAAGPETRVAAMRQLVTLVDVDARDHCDRTAVHYAASCGNVEGLSILIKAGADVETFDSGGWSPLHYACEPGFGIQCLQLLLAIGVDPNIKNKLTGASVVSRSSGQLFADQRLSLLIATGIDHDLEHPTRKENISIAKQQIQKLRLDLVREQALQVCVGLQSLEIDALCMCEIVQFACPPAHLLPFHLLWRMVTTVKHHHRRHNEVFSSIVT